MIINPDDKFNGRVQVRWDASSFDAFSRCPRYYKHKYLDAFSDPRTGFELEWGKAFHACMEVYDIGIVQGKPEPLGDALEFAYTTYKDKLSDNGESVLHYANLVKAISRWHAAYSPDTLTTITLPDGTPGVELYFTVDVKHLPDKAWSGRIDRLATDEEGNLWIIDRKTTKSSLGSFYFRRFQANAQAYSYVISLQSLGLQPKGFIIDAVNPQVKDIKLMRHAVVFDPEVLAEFQGEMVDRITQADTYAAANYFPRNLSACGGFGQQGCPFAQLCSNPDSRRESIIVARYQNATS